MHQAKLLHQLGTLHISIEQKPLERLPESRHLAADAAEDDVTAARVKRVLTLQNGLHIEMHAQDDAQ